MEHVFFNHLQWWGIWGNGCSITALFDCRLCQYLSLIIFCVTCFSCSPLQVVALPLAHRPLFPGFYMPMYVKVGASL